MDDKGKYETLLSELKSQYNKGNMSVLVGAGFSKNAIDNFPLWDQLLYDLVVDLYKSEIDSAFYNELHISPKIKVDRNEITKLKVKEIINRKGYLELVSQYIERKGYRESIETYIEERIPYIDPDDNKIKIANRSIKDLEEEDLVVHKRLVEGKWSQIYTTNYDNLIEYTARKYEKSWRAILNGYDLSFSDTKKNIIKIHGDLNQNGIDGDFCFDSCNEHRYIISKEDYDTYPQHHEAFAQLMRISLLQGTFCLLGFSGNDPNFISWIKWVKDILLKNTGTSKPSEKKVFLITVDDEPPAKELELFYKNHYIAHIPLKHTFVKQIIEADPDENQSKILLKSWFNYLIEESSNKNFYNDLWREAFHAIRNKENIETINHILSKIRIAHSNHRLLRHTAFQEFSLSSLRETKIFSVEHAEIAIIALEDTHLSPQIFQIRDKIESALDLLNDTYRKKYESIIKRFEVLTDNNVDLSKNEPLIFEYILSLAFKFDFVNLKKAIENWHPEGFRKQHLSIFKYLFGDENAKDALVSYINEESDDKEKFYATQLANMMSNQHPYPFSTSNYENMGLIGLYELRDTLFESINRSDGKILPYGENQRTLLSPQNYKESLSFLQFLIESGSLLRFSLYSFLNAEKWYVVFKNLYKDYLYPCIYYSLQCSNKDVLRRIGQDLAYDDQLIQKEIPHITTTLIENLSNKTLPTMLVDGTMWILSELFISVDPSHWEKPFLEVWKDVVLQNYSKIDHHIDGTYQFACNGLLFLRNPSIRKEIIKDCLAHAKEQPENTINYLYYLNIEETDKTDELDDAISDFCKSMALEREITIAGNIRKLLTEKNIQDVLSFIQRNVTYHSEENVLYPALYFIKQMQLDDTFFKEKIKNHSRLWFNGVVNNQKAVGGDFLHLSVFLKELEWSQEDIEIIYAKLKSSFETLINSSWYKKKTFILPFRHDKLLMEMHLFLQMYHSILVEKEDYLTIQKQIADALSERQGFHDLDEGLISNDRDTIINAMNALYREIGDKNISEFMYQIKILVSHFLLTKEIALDACIEYLSIYMQKYFDSPNKDLLADIQNDLCLGIKKYQKETLFEMKFNLPKTMLYLITIAEVLKKHGLSNSGIEYWLEIKESKRFNWDGIKKL